MHAVTHGKLAAGAAVLLLVVAVLIVVIRPVQADAASDLVREVARLQDSLDKTARALEGIQSELASMRRTFEGSPMLSVDQTSSTVGRGIPVVIQNP